MELMALWDKEFKKQVQCITECTLDEWLDLLHLLDERHVAQIAGSSLYDDEALWEWLDSKNDIIMTDKKRELRGIIKRLSYKEDAEVDSLMEYVGARRNPKALVLGFQQINVYYISKIRQYYKAVQQYLSMEKKHEFCQDLSMCFENIYFHEDVKTSINTLNRKFEEMRVEIVEHLAALNDYHEEFMKLVQEGAASREVAGCFTKDTGIHCSPQAGRDGIKLLKWKVRNKASGVEEEITCELHTKFKKHNIDKTKQDRIYFFPGRKGIEDGKIIVKHIGKHL